MIPLEDVVVAVADLMDFETPNPEHLGLVCDGLRRSINRSPISPAEYARIKAMEPPDPTRRGERIKTVMCTILPSRHDTVVLSAAAEEMPRLSLQLLAQTVPERRRQELCDLLATVLLALRSGLSS